MFQKQKEQAQKMVLAKVIVNNYLFKKDILKPDETYEIMHGELIQESATSVIFVKRFF